MNHPNEFDPLDVNPFEDLRPIIAGGLQVEKPTVARVWEGSGALYAGRIGSVMGEPGMGKTNVSIAFALHAILEGGTVVFLDPEDNAPAILRRCQSFGADLDLLPGRLHYIQDPTPEQYDEAILWAQKHRPSLVIVDGFAASLAKEGRNEDIAADCLGFIDQRLTPFAKTGAAVLVSDHVAKNKESRGRWARGSGAKLGRFDGAVYSVEVVEPYSPIRAGRLRFKIAKDRCGGIGTLGQTVGDLTFTPNGEGCTAIKFEAHEPTDRFIPTGIMDKIMAHLAINPDAGKRELRALGKSEYVEIAIRELITNGSIKSEMVGQKMRFTVIKTEGKSA